MKNAIKVAALLLGGMLVAPLAVRAQNPSPDGDVLKRAQAQADVKDGEAAAGTGNWALAREKFLSATQLDQQNVIAFYDLGVACGHMAALGEAAKAEKQAIDIDPAYTAAYVELGWILSRTEDLDAAADAEQRALRLEPGNKVALRNLDAIQSARRAAYRNKQQPARTQSRVAFTGGADAKMLIDGARGSYNDLQTLQMLLSTGERAFRERRLEAAQRNFEQAILLAPSNAQAHADLGVVLGSKGDFDAQIVEERRAVAIDPAGASAWTSLGWALAKKQKWPEALAAYQKALIHNPQMVEAQIGQALSLFNTGEKEAGLAAMKQAKATAADKAAPRVALGTLYLEQDRKEEAEAELRAALQIEPGNPEAKQQLGLLLLQSGRSEEAAQMFQDVAQRLPDNANAHAGLSLALELKGDVSAAEVEARKALDLNPRLQMAEATLDRLAQKRAGNK